MHKLTEQGLRQIVRRLDRRAFWLWVGMVSLLTVLVYLLTSCSESKSPPKQTEVPTEEAKHETAEEYNARMREEALKKNGQKKNLSKKESGGKKPGKWYEGGTLHRAKIEDWKKATDENRLATCADFIAKVRKPSDLNELLAKSVGLRACITEATRALESTNNENVADVAALCVVTLGYQ